MPLPLQASESESGPLAGARDSKGPRRVHGRECTAAWLICPCRSDFSIRDILCARAPAAQAFQDSAAKHGPGPGSPGIFAALQAGTPFPLGTCNKTELDSEKPKRRQALVDLSQAPSGWCASSKSAVRPGPSLSAAVTSQSHAAFLGPGAIRVGRCREV